MEYDGVILQVYGSGLEFDLTKVHEIVGTITMNGKDYLLVRREAKEEVKEDETV
jgi:hypothetical protein